MDSVIRQQDLDPDDQELLGLTPDRGEPNLSESALRWIETAAYHLWLNEGRPEGKHLAHWDRARHLYWETHRHRNHG